jgi:hypothetical protein
MGLLKHATVSGINEAAERCGLIAWESPDFAQGACKWASDRLGGGEALTGPLPTKTAADIFGLLKQAHAKCVAAGMRVPELAAHAKTAASRDIREVAYEKCAAVINAKLAEAGGGSLTSVGPNTPESAAQTDSVAALDHKNRPQGTYLVGMGNSNMPVGGVVGKELEPTVPAANSSPTPNSVTEHSKVSSQLAAKGLTPEKVAHMAQHGSTPEARQAAGRMLVALQKEAAASVQLDPLDAAISRVFKGAEDGAGGGGLSPEEQLLMQALQQAGIDPSAIDPSEIQEVLQAMGAGGGGGGGGAPPSPPSGGGGGGPPEKDEEAEKKEAAYLQALAKIAGGSLTNVGKNTPESAAQTNDIAALDNENRKPGAYLVGQGKSSFGTKGQGQQLAVERPAKAPTTGPNTTASREIKSAEDQEYAAMVVKVAQTYGAQLPAAMPEAEKIAHIKTLVGLPPAQRPKYVAQLTG